MAAAQRKSGSDATWQHCDVMATGRSVRSSFVAAMQLGFKM
jgi:hypothetical protein